MRELLRRAAARDPHMSEVVRGAGAAFGAKGLGVAGLLGLQALLGRTLGAEGTGLFLLALTLAVVASVVGRVGLDNAILRLAAGQAETGDWRGVAGVARHGILTALATSAAACAALYALAPALADHVFGKPELVAPLRGLALAVVPISLLFLLAELLKAVRRIGLSQLLQNAPPLLAIGLLLPAAGALDAGTAARGYAAAALLALALAGLAWRRATPRLRGVRGSFDLRRLAASAAPLYGAALLALLLEWLPALALGVWGSKAELGLFQVAHRTALLTSFALAAVNHVAAPQFAALHARGDLRAMERTARRSALLMAAAAAPLLALFLLAPSHVMRVFGPDFATGGPLLSILAVGQFVNAAVGSVGFLLIMSGNGAAFRNATAVAATLQIALCATLVPAFGAVGAALASASSVVCLNLVAAALVASRLGIRTLPIPRRRGRGGALGEDEGCRSAPS